MKISFPVILLLFVSLSAFAQRSFGLKGGLNYSRVIQKNDTSGWDGYKFAPSFHVGVFGGISLSEKAMLAGEFLLSDKPFGYKSNSGSSHLLYINLPVLFSYNISKRFALHAGPQAGLLIATFGKNSETLSEIYSIFDLCLVTGVDFKLTESFTLTFRFEQGLSNMINREASSLQYSYIQDGDPVIVGRSLREAGYVQHSQNLQLSVKYALYRK